MPCDAAQAAVARRTRRRPPARARPARRAAPRRRAPGGEPEHGERVAQRLVGAAVALPARRQPLLAHAAQRLVRSARRGRPRDVVACCPASAGCRTAASVAGEVEVRRAAGPDARLELAQRAVARGHARKAGRSRSRQAWLAANATSHLRLVDPQRWPPSDVAQSTSSSASWSRQAAPSPSSGCADPRAARSRARRRGAAPPSIAARPSGSSAARARAATRTTSAPARPRASSRSPSARDAADDAVAGVPDVDVAAPTRRRLRSRTPGHAPCVGDRPRERPC